jgi:hypothetical protein
MRDRSEVTARASKQPAEEVLALLGYPELICSMLSYITTSVLEASLGLNIAAAETAEMRLRSPTRH